MKLNYKIFVIVLLMFTAFSLEIFAAAIRTINSGLSGNSVALNTVENVEGIEGLVQADSADSDARSAEINQLIQTMYQQIEKDFIKLFMQFLELIEKEIVDFTNSAPSQGQSVASLEKTLQQNLDDFIKQVDLLSKKTIQDYYRQMTQITGQLYGDQTDPFVKTLDAMIKSLEHEIIFKMQTMIQQLLNPNNLDQIGQQAQLGVQSYEKMAAQDYEFRQQQASQSRNRTWWDEFSATSSQFMTEFSKEVIAESQVQFEKACKESLQQSLKKGMSSSLGLTPEQEKRYNKPLSELSGAISGSLINAVSPVVSSAGSAAVKVGSTITGYVPSVDSMVNFTTELATMSMTDMMKLNPLYTSMMSSLQSSLRAIYPSGQDNSAVVVRTNIGLCQQEQNFVKNRMPKAQIALQKNFNITVPLKIALCASGGGNRAMLTTLGYLLGMEDIGILDATLYSAGVSGSTWTICPWGYFNATQAMSLTDFKNQLVPRLNQSAGGVGGLALPPLPEEYERTTMSRSFAQRIGYDLYLSSIDLYGGFIGNFTLFPAGKERLKVTWSSIADQVEKGTMPLPMGAAVSYIEGQKKTGLTDYYWFEIGPFEAGSDQVGAYVNTKAFGSQFNQGKVVPGYAGQAPEYPISFYEGVYGSAFAFSANEALDRFDLNQTISFLGQTITVPINDIIRMATPTNVSDARIYPATFHNYAKGLASSPLENADTIRLYDGAMDFNFPLPLVMRPARGVDLILLCDASNNMIELQNAQIHCKNNGLKFPDLSKYSQDQLENSVLTVLNDPSSADYDKNMVTILYCPLVKNSAFSTTFDPVVCTKNGACNTFNFKYSQDQANLVIDLVRFNVNGMKDQIAGVLKALEQKKLAIKK